MFLLEGISQLATCRAEGGQADIHAIQDGALAWEGDTIRWAGPRRELPAEYARRGSARRRWTAGDPGAGRLPHPSRLRRMARRRVRAADSRPELPGHRGGRRRDRADHAAHPRGVPRVAGRALGRIPPRDGLPRRHHGRVQERLRARPRARARPCSRSTARSRGTQPVRLVPTFLGAHVVPPEFQRRSRRLSRPADRRSPPAHRAGATRRVLRRLRGAVGVHRGGGPTAAAGRPGRGTRRQASRRSVEPGRRRGARGGGGSGLGGSPGVRVGGGDRGHGARGGRGGQPAAAVTVSGPGAGRRRGVGSRPASRSRWPPTSTPARPRATISRSR